MPTVLITGANRGLGLEFVRQYAADGWQVHAACRRPDAASALAAVDGNVHRHALDVSDPASLRALGAQITEALDVVIANAGLGAKDVGAFGAIDYTAWSRTFDVNVRGAVGTAEAFAPHLVRAKGRLAVISSLMGSIAEASSGSICYRSSKAAVNMASCLIAAELAPSGVAVAPFHPGWVQTDMGGAGAPTTPADSIAGLRVRIAEMVPTPSPRFLDYIGREIPW